MKLLTSLKKKDNIIIKAYSSKAIINQTHEKGNVMTYSIQKQEEIQVLSVDNLISEFENRQILEEVKDIIETGSNRFVIDLSELRFLNSAGLNFLISVLTKSRNAGGDTVITNVSEDASKLLVLTKLKHVFTTANSVEDAYKLFANLN